MLCLPRDYSLPAGRYIVRMDIIDRSKHTQFAGKGRNM